jgi:hypothetical protein
MTAESTRTEELTGLESYAKVRVMQRTRCGCRPLICTDRSRRPEGLHSRVSRALNCLSHAPSLAAAGLAMIRIHGRQAQG